RVVVEAAGVDLEGATAILDCEPRRRGAAFRNEPADEIAPQPTPLLPAKPAIRPSAVRVGRDRERASASVLPRGDERRRRFRDADVAAGERLELRLDEPEHGRPARIALRKRAHDRRVAHRQWAKLPLDERLFAAVL